jgi:hypothetical protein
MLVQGIICFIIGCIVIVVGICITFSKRKLLKTGVDADATVIRTVAARNGQRNGVTHVPVFSYTIGNETHEVMHRVGNMRPKYADGEVVKIRYSADSPSKFVVLGDKTTYFGTVVCIISGLLSFGLGAIFLLAQYNY